MTRAEYLKARRNGRQFLAFVVFCTFALFWLIAHFWGN